MRLERKVWRRYCQMFSCGLASGHLGGCGQQRDIGGQLEFLGHVPSGAVEDDEGMSAFGDCGGNGFEMLLHGLSVDLRHGEGCACTAGWANGAEQISAVITLVGRLAWPGSALGPLIDLTVLLSDPHLVLEPHFNGGSRRQMLQNIFGRLAEVFLNAAASSPLRS